MHVVVIYPTIGEYVLMYYHGSSVPDTEEGYATIITASKYNVLDLRKMTPEQRWSLGPVVMYINPKPCTSYEVVVIDIYGNKYPLPAPACSSSEGKPIFDAMLLWEDLWYPGTAKQTLDNWVDEVVRVVVFQVSNDKYVAEIWVIRGSGAYLHMFILGKLTASEIYNIVSTYQSHDHILKDTQYYNKVAYVKPHGTVVPPGKLWNPNTGTWISTPTITMTITLS
jgi:hypothetical protein